MESAVTAPGLTASAASPISRAERRWLVLFGAGVMLLTMLPYLVGYARQGTDWVFTGFVFGVEDGNSYLAKMKTGSAGAWLFRSPYTASHQRGVLAFLPYLLLGKLAASPGLHLQLAVLFHLFRLAAGFLAIWATYDFLAFFLRPVALRRSGLALACLGGGLGWVPALLGEEILLGSLPLEFYSPETFGFLHLYGLPHLALARAALLWGLLAYLRAARQLRFQRSSQPALQQGLKIGLLWLLVALCQPLTALVFAGVIGLHLLAGLILARPWKEAFRRNAKMPRASGISRRCPSWSRCLRLALYAALLPAPFLLYNTLAFSLDPFLASWTTQNRILSPHPLHYLLAYGLLLPFASIGARRVLRRRPWEAGLLVAWMLALPLLAYAPFNLQRRLPEGMWVVLVILALLGRQAAAKPRSGTLRAPRLISPFLFAFPSTLILLGGGLQAAWRPAEPVFRQSEEVNAYRFIQSRARKGAVVLSAYETGNPLPAWAPVRVVIGHGPESANLEALLPQVAGFYNAQGTDSERLAFLNSAGVGYVIWGPAERQLGDWDPYQAAYLQPSFQSGPYHVFETRLNAGIP